MSSNCCAVCNKRPLCEVCGDGVTYCHEFKEDEVFYELLTQRIKIDGITRELDAWENREKYMTAESVLRKIRLLLEL
jgi:hypothetical protein